MRLAATWMDRTAWKAEMNRLVAISIYWPPGVVLGYAIVPPMNFEI